MNEEALTEPLELGESELYAVAGGFHPGFHQLLSDVRSGGQVDINLIFVEVGNGNRVTTGSRNARGSTSGSSSVDTGNGNEVIIYA